MKPPPFDYLHHVTLDDALDMLSQHGDQAKVLASGQNLVPMMNFRLGAPCTLIDINRIAELTDIVALPDRLTLKALVCWCEPEVSPNVGRHNPVLQVAIRHIAHYPIRNRGMVGGSGAHADPAAGFPAVALAYGADFTVRGARGTRTLSAHNFFRGSLETVPIDMHVDETDDPDARTLEMLADQAIANGWQARVSAGHICALAAYPHDCAVKVIDKVKQAIITMITLPVTNLVLQGRLDREPRRRDITRVKELLQACVNVTFGQDCVYDTFYPFGRADLLEVATATAHTAQMTLPREIETVFEMCTQSAARACGFADYDLAPGSPADVVVLDARTPTEAIIMPADCRFVIKSGCLLAETKATLTRHWNAGAAEFTPAHA
jgi:hypothetical protein